MSKQVYKIANSTKVELLGSNKGFNQLRSITICNIHDTDPVAVDLYLTSQVGDDITTTSVYAAETEAASGSSVTLTVDNGSGSGSAATSDNLDEEQVWKSDGTLFGTCTEVTNNTTLVFSAGLTNTITNNDILYVGTRYYILKGFILPVAQTLKLEGDEVSFDNLRYSLSIKLGSSTPVDVIIN